MNRINYIKIIFYTLALSLIASGLTAIIFKQNFFHIIMEITEKTKLTVNFTSKWNALGYLLITTGLFAILPANLASTKIFKPINKISNKLGKYFFFLITSSAIAILAFNNINSPNFWFDESGQFWIAKGLKPFSPAFSNYGGLIDVYRNNNLYNLDPGGFSYLLYFWSGINQSPAFLRTLPFLFIIMSFYILYSLLKNQVQEKKLVIILPLLMMSSPIITQYAFELRAYSFEIFTSISALFLAINSDRVVKSSRYSLLAGLLMALGLTSRYSAILTVFVASSFVLFATFKARRFKSWINFSLYTLPVITTLILIYFFIIKIQNPSINPPDYVANYFIKNSSIFKLFFHPFAVLVWLPVFLLSIFFIFKRENIFIRNYLLFCLVLLIILLTLSFFGKYPLAFYTRFDLSVHTIFWFGWIVLLAKMFQFFKARLAIKKIKFLFMYFIVVILILIVSSKYQENDSIHDNFNKCIDLYNGGKSILANQGSMPTIRYLFELGPFKEYVKTYSEIVFFDEGLDKTNEQIKVSDIDIDNFEYFLFSFFNKENTIYKYISTNSLYQKCLSDGFSYLYFRK
jgi:hypothetical protein